MKKLFTSRLLALGLGTIVCLTSAIAFSPACLAEPGSSASPALPANPEPSIQELLEQSTRQHHERHQNLAPLMMPHKPQPVVFPARRVKAEKPFNDGLTAMYRQNYKKAARDFGRAASIDPSYEKAWMFQGDAYMELGNYQLAIASYDKAIERHKTFSRLYTSRGKAYAAAGKYQEAIADYDRALEVYPEDPTPYYYRGQSSYQLGDYDGADRDWQRAIDRFWKFYRAYRARADMRLERGDLAGALADYQAGVGYAKDDRNLEVASYFQGQIDRLQLQSNLVAWSSSPQTAISSNSIQSGAILSKLGNYSQLFEGLWKRVLQIRTS